MDSESDGSSEASACQNSVGEGPTGSSSPAGTLAPCANEEASPGSPDSSTDVCAPLASSKSNFSHITSLCSTSNSEPRRRILPPPLPPKQLVRTRSLPIVKPCCHQMWATQYPGSPISSPLCQHPLCAVGGHNPPSSPRCREKAPVNERRRLLTKYHSMDRVFPTAFTDPQMDIEHLKFATPDDELGAFFEDLKNKEEVCDKVRRRHLVSLCRISAKLQEMLTATEGVPTTEVTWSDYVFLDSEPCFEAGDAWYYRVCTASGSQHILAAKVHKINDPSDAPLLDPVGLALQKSIHRHFNIQELGACFTGQIPTEIDSPLISSSTGTLNPSISNSASRLAQIALTAQLPCKTLAGFVEEFHGMHTSEPSDYERLVCLLLLQLCNGLEHLKAQGITHCDIRPENLLIVVDMSCQEDLCSVQRKMHLPRLVISNFSKAKHSASCLSPTSALSLEQARLAPELLSTVQYKKVDEFQMGILAYELLHLPNPFQASSLLLGTDYSTADLPPVPILSPYSQGLQRLAALLLHADPRGRMSVGQAKTILQVLLWGPRRELFHGYPLGPVLLQNWLEVKRALLMMKFAEKSLKEAVAGKLEDWLCCQYFTGITEHALHYAAQILYIL